MKPDQSLTFYGTSFIAGQTGEIVAELDDHTECFAVAQFDLAKLRQTRASWGILRDRRPELYGVLTGSAAKQ